MNKICYKCKSGKDSHEFSKNKRYKDGLHDICKSCKKEDNIRHKDKIIEYNNKNKEKQKTLSKEWRENNVDKIKGYSQKYHSDPIKRKQKLEYSKEHYSKKENKLKRKEYLKKWNENNSEYMKQYMKNRYNNDINYKIKSNLRTRFYHVVKGNIKKSSVLILLCCSIEELKQHLEQQFLPEFTWENHGTIWEIDHIKACANFDLTKEEEQKQCFHYTNLQPLFKTTEIAESFGYTDQIGNQNKGKY